MTPIITQMVNFIIKDEFNLKRCDKHVSTVRSLSVNKTKIVIKELEKCNITDKIDT